MMLCAERYDVRGCRGSDERCGTRAVTHSCRELLEEAGDQFRLLNPSFFRTQIRERTSQDLRRDCEV